MWWGLDEWDIAFQRENGTSKAAPAQIEVPTQRGSCLGGSGKVGAVSAAGREGWKGRRQPHIFMRAPGIWIRPTELLGSTSASPGWWCWLESLCFALCCWNVSSVIVTLTCPRNEFNNDLRASSASPPGQCLKVLIEGLRHPLPLCYIPSVSGGGQSLQADPSHHSQRADQTLSQFMGCRRNCDKTES